LLEFLTLCAENNAELNLRVVGQCFGGSLEGPIASTIDVLSRSGSVEWIKDRSSDAEFQAHLRSMNAVILPYRSGWNSGVALTALYARRRVLASDLPIFREIQSCVGDYWVTIYEPTGPGLVRALRELERCPRRAEDDERLSRFIQGSTWRRCAEEISAFMSDIQSKADEVLGQRPVDGRVQGHPKTLKRDKASPRL
jgi:glycosyltransferase involved in cell wall biosynthesis